MTSLSVILPVYNDAARLRLCLDALANQDYPRERFEVIVIDNGSDDSPQELVEGYSFCRFAEEPQPGSYAARNRGLTLARGEVIAFTDSDCLPQPAWLSRGVAALLANDSNGLVGGRIEVFPRDEQAPTAVELYDCLYGLDQQSNVERLGFAATANAITRRAVIDAVGPFEATLKSAGDVEWGQRVSRAGYPVVWCEEAVVRHPARHTWQGLLTQARRHAGGRIDKNRAQSRSPWRWSSVTNLFVLMMPPVRKMLDASGRLREQGQGWRGVVQVWKIMILLRYAKLIAKIKAVLGFPSERC